MSVAHIRDTIRDSIDGMSSSDEDLTVYLFQLEELLTCLRQLSALWENYLDQLELQICVAGYAVRVDRSHRGLGRPRLDIGRDQLEHLLSLSFNCTQIASILGVSRMTVYRRRQEFGMLDEPRTNISDGELLVFARALVHGRRLVRQVQSSCVGLSAWRYHLRRMAKRGSDDATSSSSGSHGKQQKTGINPNWAADFPWMVACDDGAGILCSLCRKHNRRPKKVLVGRAIWVDLTCKNLTRQSLVGHGSSACHALAITMEVDLASSQLHQGP